MSAKQQQFSLLKMAIQFRDVTDNGGDPDKVVHHCRLSFADVFKSPALLYVSTAINNRSLILKCIERKDLPLRCIFLLFLQG
jgi:hypothetical protein